MDMTEMLQRIPEGDLKIEFEHVHGGWVGYVWLTPVHGPMVPASRNSIYARTSAKPSREEAFNTLPEAFDLIIKKWHLRRRQTND